MAPDPFNNWLQDAADLRRRAALLQLTLDRRRPITALLARWKIRRLLHRADHMEFAVGYVRQRLLMAGEARGADEPTARFAQTGRTRPNAQTR